MTARGKSLFIICAIGFLLMLTESGIPIPEIYPNPTKCDCGNWKWRVFPQKLCHLRFLPLFDIHFWQKCHHYNLCTFQVTLHSRKEAKLRFLGIILKRLNCRIEWYMGIICFNCYGQVMAKRYPFIVATGFLS